jgi:hypothetical protein
LPTGASAKRSTAGTPGAGTAPPSSDLHSGPCNPKSVNSTITSSAARQSPLHLMSLCNRPRSWVELDQDSLHKESRGHSGEKEQQAPQARPMIEVRSPGFIIKSFDPEVDRGLFAAVALDLVLDSLSLVE